MRSYRSAQTETYFTTGAVAKFCDVTPQAVRLWIQAGLIPTVRTAGDHYRVTRGDLETFMRSRGLEVPAEVASPKPQVVAVLEDSEATKNLRKTLSKGGYDLAVFANPWEALLSLPGSRPVVIVLDLHMAGIDGVAMLRAIKTNKSTAAIPVIALAGHAPGRNQALEAGAATVVPKTSLDRLPDLIQEHRVRRA